MENIYTKEFILAFLYNEVPFAAKREFVFHLQRNPLLRKMYYELKAAKNNLRNLKAMMPPEGLTTYIRSYAAASLGTSGFINNSNN